MAALDFPASPTNGQVYANWIYSSSKGAWQAKPLTGKVTTSAVAPSAPSNGDEWFNTNDGNLYVYYTDVDGSQWVQVKSDATLSSTLGNRVTTLETYPSGLVPVIPTSITMSSGTSSVNANGLITFNTTTATTSVSLNGCFTSAFRNYRIVYRAAGSSLGAASYARFRKAGIDSQSASFFWSGSYSRSTGTVSQWSGNASSVMDIGRLHTNTTDQKAFAIIDVLGPANGQTPMYAFAWAGEDPTSPLGGNGNGTYAISDTFDGISFFTSAGTFTGIIQVYGLR